MCGELISEQIRYLVHTLQQIRCFAKRSSATQSSSITLCSCYFLAVRSGVLDMDLFNRKRNIALIGGYITLFEEKRRKRVWSKRWYLERRNYSHMNLIRELETNEPSDLYNFFRVDSESFETLLQYVQPMIERKNTHMREAVSASFLFVRIFFTFNVPEARIIFI